MTTYRDDFVIDKVLRSAPSIERTILRVYTGKDISERDAKALWQRILDHKWCVSERLSRDVGFRVAAIDYVEHFYQPFPKVGHGTELAEYWKAFKKKAKSWAMKYFEAKGGSMPI